MRLLKLASARPVARTQALPQPFVPGTDPLVTPLKGTRAGLRVKRSQALPCNSPRCHLPSSAGLCYCLSSSIVPRAPLLPLRLYRVSGSIVLQALLSPLGLYRPLGPIASRHLSGTIAPGLCCRLFGSIASWVYCLLSSAVASQALLSPLGLHCPSGAAIASRALSRIASRAQLLPLGFCCLSGSAIALNCPFGLYPLGLCPPTVDRVTLSTATISICVSSPALRQQSRTLCM